MLKVDFQKLKERPVSEQFSFWMEIIGNTYDSGEPIVIQVGDVKNNIEINSEDIYDLPTLWLPSNIFKGRINNFEQYLEKKEKVSPYLFVENINSIIEERCFTTELEYKGEKVISSPYIENVLAIDFIV